MEKYVAKTLSEYVSISTSIASDIDDVWFRGHSSASHRLVPSALRETIPLTDGRGNNLKKGQMVNSGGGHVGGLDVEKMFFEFKSRALPFLDRNLENNFEWMFLMQHYGVPTRLLDWTTNALVALYFAIGSNPYCVEKNGFEELSPEEDFMDEGELSLYGAAVFSLNPSELNRKTVGCSSSIFICEDLDDWDHYFDPMSKEGVNNFLPIAVKSRHIDVRIRSQSGHFTLHGANVWPLDYYDEIRKLLTKIFIPYGSVPQMLKDLRSLGFTESFIYPGLDSIAKEIKRNEGVAFSRRHF